MMRTTYITNESGAVTVDWVILTAGLVGLGLATMTVVSQGVQDASGDIKTQLSNQGIGITAFNYGARINPDTDGSFTLEGFAKTITGNFIATGENIVGTSEDGRITMRDTSANNGTHAMNFDDPVSDLTISMTSLHPDQDISGVSVILADGSTVPVSADHYSTGQNPMNIDAGSENLASASITDNNGNLTFSGSGQQSEVTFNFNASNVDGLSTDNGIVGFEYDQNSAHGGGTIYALHTEATPI